MLVAALPRAVDASLLTLALVSRTTNLSAIAGTVASLSFYDLPPVILAFIGFFVALLAETGRYPFDNPATHLELTMIHEAMILEYSGKRLAVIEWGAANKYLLFIALGANLFFPWGVAHSLNALELIGSFAAFYREVSSVLCSLALIESSIAKFRIFRLPDLLFTSFIISIIAIGLII